MAVTVALGKHKKLKESLVRVALTPWGTWGFLLLKASHVNPNLSPFARVEWGASYIYQPSW